MFLYIVIKIMDSETRLSLLTDILFLAKQLAKSGCQCFCFFVCLLWVLVQLFCEG